MRENFTIRKAAKIKPKIIIYDVNEEIDDEEIINGMDAQNDLPDDSELKIEFNMKGKKGENVVVSMKPEAFNQLISKGKVNIKWGRYNLREFLKPMQCFNCYRYGHLAKFCKQKKKCQNSCSDSHETKTCQEDSRWDNCKFHNERFNTIYDTHNNIRDKNCFVYESKIGKLRSRIDYGSSN